MSYVQYDLFFFSLFINIVFSFYGLAPGNIRVNIGLTENGFHCLDFYCPKNEKEGSKIVILRICILIHG